MRYALIVLLLVFGLSGYVEASGLIETKCDDGYVYKLYSRDIVQALAEDGKPQICGDRLVKHNEGVERQLKAFATYQKLMLDARLEMINLTAPSILGAGIGARVGAKIE